MDIIQALIDLGSVSGTEWHIGNNAGTFEILNNCSGDILFSILNDGTLATGSNFSTNPEFLNQYSNITIGTQFGNYTLTSNYVLSTSNILVRRILREDIYSSNYTQSTSNYLILKANENEANASNYILSTSNNLINKALENDRNASNYIMYTSNNLILKANFNDTNSSNYILTASNNLINKIRENDNNSSNYILTASNNLINNTLRTSNNLINKMNENDRNSSNNLINKINENDRNSSNYIRSTSNILAQRINKYSVWEPTTSNIYYYSSGNVGIGTTTPQNKLHICETATSNIKLTIQNNYLLNLAPITPNEIIVTGATSVTINATDRYISFPYSGTGATKDYTFTTTENLQCDILLVGGGGSGGNLSSSGGGGGGGYVYLQNINMTQGSFSVSVGKGGGMRQSFAFGGENGANSSITGSGINYTALGGGGGGGNIYYDVNTLGIGKNGGSGGGGGLRGYTDGLTAVGGTSTQFSTYGYGNGGNGNSFYYAGPFGAGQRYTSGGGGGGASGITNGYSAKGNDGLSNSITGVSVTYAGGGGAGFAYDSLPYTEPLTDGGAGGGGKGQLGGAANEDGVDGLGGGGGGANNGYAGKGGSGIVIIRYRCAPNIITSSIASASIDLVRGLPADANTDYKIGNFNGDFKIMSSTSNVDISRLHIDSSGNVGIGTSVPENRFHICDANTSNTKLTIQNNYLTNTANTIPNEIVVAGTTLGTIGTTERYISFPYSGTDTTKNYTFTTTGNLTCDVLLVGGGGGGGDGGGGGGGYVYMTNLNIPAGSYSVNVGKGGNGGNAQSPGSQGASSSFIVGGTTYTAYGGGGGGHPGSIAPAHTTGQVGSYGGNGMDGITSQTYTSTQGNRGGAAITTIYGSGGGGGGAGGIGGNANYGSPSVTAGDSRQYYRGGTGGDGLPNNITGTEVFYAGGGTGGANTNQGTDTTPQTPPLGGGGIGSRAPNGFGGNGVDGTGGGGGGGEAERSSASGRGGSGIVIIRYRSDSSFVSGTLSSASIDLVRGMPDDANTDYKLGNFNGDFKIMSSMSNVDTNRLLLTSNGDMTINGNIEAPAYLSGGRNILSVSSNYVLSTSNLISQRITDLTTDMITENVNATKKFIVNNRYNNNLELNGTLTINSNLIVLGDSTRLDTIVYTTERLEIINANNTATAFMVQQNSADRDIIVASNMSTAVFRVANNGDVLINGDGVYKRNNRDVIWDTSNYVLTASNNLILKANAIDAYVSNYIQTASNNLIINTISNDAKISILCNTILAVATVNDTNTSNYVMTASNNLILKADMNDRNASNYVMTASNNLVLKADMNDRNASNYVMTASNNLILKADMNDRNASNYVLNTSNTLVNIIRARADAITTSQWTGSSNIYFNLGNVGIGTTNPSTDLHLYDEVISDTKLTIQNNSLVAGYNFTAAATITPSGGTISATGQITSSIDKFIIFSEGSSSFTVPAGGLNCDILMIGGGGGWNGNGGGGAGACIVTINQTLPAGNCVVNVGQGGTYGNNGMDSFITVGGIDRYRAKGGGCGGPTWDTAGTPGGCGGGADFNKVAGTESGGAVVGTNVVTLPNGLTTTTFPTITSTYAVLGNPGGDNSGPILGPGWGNSGSGGGIGAAGVSTNSGGKGGDGAYQVTLLGASTPINFRNYFGNGTTIGVDGVRVSGSATLGDKTGNYYIGGGAGGGDGNYTGGGGYGGGGINGYGGSSGIANTGGGGVYGAGGSGIVAIRYRIATLTTPTLGNPSIELIRGIASDSNTDYKIGNYGGDFKIMSSTSNIDTNRVLLTSNGDMTLSGSLNASSFLLGGSNILIKVDDTSNYIRSASNLISQRITNLTTDMITESATKKFIINNSYNNNLELNGTLTINSNLIVLGDSTRLDTIVYTTERLEVVNANNTTTALMVQQNSADRDIFVASNMSATVFKIANNGDVHINGNYNKNNRDVIQDTSNYILTTSNLLINYNNLINRPGLTQWIGNSNITYNLGNVGIGTTVPLERLHVVGDIVATNNITSYYSDERLKTKTGGIYEPLEIVGKLNGFYYTPNALANLYGITNTDTEIGLSAQDVQRVLPEIVNIAPFDLARDADDNKVSKSGENYLTISYERLAPVFVEAIKELKNEIVMLKQRVAFLEQK
jgi:hypothetical protein